MGLLDSVLGGLLGGSGGSASPMGGVLSGLLGGGQQGGMGMSKQGAMGGGLSGLISQFEGAGLGHITQSWVGNGPNQPVSPQQLQSVFGEQQVQGMASQAGMAPNDFLSQPQSAPAERSAWHDAERAASRRRHCVGLSFVGGWQAPTPQAPSSRRRP